MDIQSEMRLVQIGPGISISYTIFSCQSLPEDPDTDIGGIGDIFALTTEIGGIGDIFMSPTTLQFKNQQHQWITVAEGDHIRHPTHQNCRLLLSNTGPHWGFVCQPFLTVLEAIKEHLDRIKRGDVFMPEDEDDLDEDDLDDWDDDDEEEDEFSFMAIKPRNLKLRQQYGSHYIPDSDGATASEPETVVTTSVDYERELEAPSWALSNYSPKPEYESHYQRSMESFHGLSVDMFDDLPLPMQQIQEGEGNNEQPEREPYQCEGGLDEERAKTPSPSTSTNITPLQQTRKNGRARKNITPQRARKLAAQLSKELARLESVQIRTQKLYRKMLMLSQD
ncbi:hypothetical protein M413DRAFT_14308 [Hebeloma cylindrosporum]|uniref:Uncharacterized protein n=1 Tax=Hebeloma cylindrosporum TaxID=76867 RepID=A0A0C2Y408_HEBCY|nr:hypothetical protein M413DRAFT_14308 [Hebeloma cylindrosporum h7]